MRILLKILFIISALITLIFFALFVMLFISWINGGGNVLFPGLGLIVTISLVVIAFFIMTILSAAITFLLYKFAFRTLDSIKK